MIARIAAVTLAAFALGGCIATTGGEGDGGPPPGPEWMVGTWQTTLDMSFDTTSLELHRDGNFSIMNEPIGPWASDGVALQLGNETFEFVRSAGCHFMTLNANPAPGVFDHKVFVKDDVAGCPDAPAPLSSPEQSLVGRWRLDSEYGSDYTVFGTLTLNADRRARIFYSKNLSNEWTTHEVVAEGNWTYSEEHGRIDIRIPTFAGGEGVSYDVALDELGGIDRLCVSPSACVNVWRE